MDQAVDGAVLAADEKSEGFERVVGEKRMAEGGDDGAPAKKKPRGGSGAVESMRRVAEIVLVLSAMAKMRGGRSPTEAEMEMMAEARAKVAELCGELPPKDVVPRDAVAAVMEDLGLNKIREQRFGIRPPKMSIAEKMLFTKKKMEETKALTAHTASYSSQRPLMADNSGTSSTVRMFPSEKPCNPPTSFGGIQSAFPLSQTSGALPAPLPSQYHLNGVRPSTVSTGISSGQFKKDSYASMLPKADRPHIRLNGANGTSYDTHVKATPNAHPPVKVLAWPSQPQAAPSTKIGPENKVPSYGSIKIEEPADKNASREATHIARYQNSKLQSAQAVAGILPHQPSQASNHVHASSAYNGHSEISIYIQRLLHPQLPQHPAWTPPSRDYMDKALTCQECRLTMNDVESALVCDYCEKGYHLKCILNLKGIPRGEWHCSRCLASSNGKPLPPKYGRVMRNMTAPKVSLNSSGVQSSPQKKTATLDQQINHQKVKTNEHSSLERPHAATTGSGYVNSASDVKTNDAREMLGKSSLSKQQEVKGNSLPSIRQENDEGPDSGHGLNSTLSPSMTDEPSSHQSSPEKKLATSDQQINHEKVKENGNPGVEHIDAATMGSSDANLESDVEMHNDNEIEGESLLSKQEEVKVNGLLSTRKETGEGPDSGRGLSSNLDPSVLDDSKMKGNSSLSEQEEAKGNSLSSTRQEADEVPDSSSDLNSTLNSEVTDGTCSGRSNEPSVHTDSSVCDQRTSSESKSYPLAKTSEILTCSADNNSEPPCLLQHVDQKGLPEEVPLEQYHDKPSTCEQRPDIEVNSQPPVKSFDTLTDREDHSQAASDSQHVAQKGSLAEDLSKQFHVDTSPSEERTDKESKLQPPVDSSDSLTRTEEHSQTTCKSHVDQIDLPAEVPLDQRRDGPEDVDKTHVTEEIEASIGQVAHETSKISTESSSGTKDQGGFSEEGMHSVDWVGNAVNVLDEKTFYQSCCIKGITYNVQDYVLLRARDGRLRPSKLQEMWETSRSSSKWISVSQCYFYDDLLEVVKQTHSPVSNEVFKCNHADTVMAGLIHGPCEVLPPDEYQEECKKRAHLGTDATKELKPLFQCTWLYDKLKGLSPLV